MTDCKIAGHEIAGQRIW